MASHSGTIDPRINRAILGLFAIGVFIVLVSAIVPFGSSAEDRYEDVQISDPRWQASEFPPELNHFGWPLLGSLEGARYRVWIYSSPEGPAYTVIDEYGWIIEENLLEEEIREACPELELEGMIAPVGENWSPVMLVDPAME